MGVPIIPKPELPSGELTWQLKSPMFNRRYILTRSIFCCHVSLLEGKGIFFGGEDSLTFHHYLFGVPSILPGCCSLAALTTTGATTGRFQVRSFNEEDMNHRLHLEVQDTVGIRG